MNLDIVAFGYLFLRLAPFILVCFFSLASIFNQDLRGLIYLIGLLLACSSVAMVGKFANQYNLLLPVVGQPELCKLIAIGDAENNIFASLPLSQTTFGYTFAYLLYFILKSKNNLVQQNIATIVFFPLLILADLWWNKKNNCYRITSSMTALLISAAVGILWAAIIESTKSPNLPYFSGMNNNEICSRPTKQSFKCNVYKNGKLISKNIGG
jgi:hypothetical protein